MPSCSTLHLPPPFRPRPLSVDVASLHLSLLPHLPPSARPAVYRLPSHLVLPLSHLPLTLVHLNSRWTPHEAARAACDTNVSHLLLPALPAHPALQHLLRQLPSLPVLTLRRDPSADILVTTSRFASSAPVPNPAPHPTPHAIFFTSGTTARPKPVLLPLSALSVQSRAKIALLSLSRSTVYLHLSPLFHLGGFSSAHAVALANGTHIFPPPALRPSHTPDAHALLQYARTTNVNTLVLVPTVLQMLVDAAAGRHFPNIRTVLYGGSQLSRACRSDAMAVFPNAKLFGAYGMTETASSMTFLCHNDLPHDSLLHASAGWPPPHVQVRVQPTADKVVVRSPHGEQVVGEVHTRGPHLMRGYDGEAGMSKHGWFRTGDLGYVDSESGALFVVGRRKDMIKSGGENVFAAEVEEALVACVEVKEAAVVGIPHRVLGEAVAAAVVLVEEMRRPETEILKQLWDSCRDCLSPFKRPKWIVKQNYLPRNATGKVLKDKVREHLRRQILEPRAKL